MVVSSLVVTLLVGISAGFVVFIPDKEVVTVVVINTVDVSAVLINFSAVKVDVLLDVNVVTVVTAVVINTVDVSAVLINFSAVKVDVI